MLALWAMNCGMALAAPGTQPVGDLLRKARPALEAVQACCKADVALKPLAEGTIKAVGEDTLVITVQMPEQWEGFANKMGPPQRRHGEITIRVYQAVRPEQRQWAPFAPPKGCSLGRSWLEIGEGQAVLVYSLLGNPEAHGRLVERVKAELANVGVAVIAPESASKPDQPAAAEPAALDIQCDKEGDAIKVRTEAGRTILQITSPRGIGGATITRTGDHWPKELVLRIYLGGLEQLSIASGDVRLSASVLSHSGHPRLLHLWKKNEEGPPLDKTSPYWMEIAAYDAQGKPIDGLPDKGGWFEMTIPKALLVDQEKVLKLHWIDFFRR